MGHFFKTIYMFLQYEDLCAKLTRHMPSGQVVQIFGHGSHTHTLEPSKQNLGEPKKKLKNFILKHCFVFFPKYDVCCKNEYIECKTSIFVLTRDEVNNWRPQTSIHILVVQSSHFGTDLIQCTTITTAPLYNL